MVEVVETLARSVRMEMDFRLEAAAASEFAENTARDADFRVPKVDWDRTQKDVLTLEWIDGTPLSDHEGVLRTAPDAALLGRTVIQSFLRHAMRDGFFHADMHQGNLFVDRDGRLVDHWGEGIFEDAHGICITPDDTVYFVDRDPQVVITGRSGSTPAPALRQ